MQPSTIRNLRQRRMRLRRRQSCARGTSQPDKWLAGAVAGKIRNRQSAIRDPIFPLCNPLARERRNRGVRRKASAPVLRFDNSGKLLSLFVAVNDVARSMM